MLVNWTQRRNFLQVKDFVVAVRSILEKFNQTFGNILLSSTLNSVPNLNVGTANKLNLLCL